MLETMKLFKKKTQPVLETEVEEVDIITKEEQQVIDRFKDKIYFYRDYTLPGDFGPVGIRSCIINLRTTKSIARAAGIVKPEVWRDTPDGDPTGDEYSDNNFFIQYEMYDHWGEDPEKEVLELYRFCKWVKEKWDKNGWS